MAVLRMICGTTTTDHIRNLDILKVSKGYCRSYINTETDYFGRVTHMKSDRYPHILLHGYTWAPPCGTSEEEMDG